MRNVWENEKLELEIVIQPKSTESYSGKKGVFYVGTIK
jgi:hypothetical protein